MSENAAPTGTTSAAANGNRPRAHVIVVGNEKGGSGKTTTTMHLIVALLRLGFTVGSLDIDSRQRSLSRYLDHRQQTAAKTGGGLPLPKHIVVDRSARETQNEAQEDERERFAEALAQVVFDHDFVVIDSPGSDTFLARLAHSFADTVVTPINDSFIDLDVLAHVDGESLKIVKPSIYSQMLWEQKMQRMQRDNGTIDWVVMRNRLSNLDARNKRMMAAVVETLAKRVGFRVAAGFSERVIFRDMFLSGLTVLDVLETAGASGATLSHIGARQEVRDLLATLKIDKLDARLAIGGAPVAASKPSSRPAAKRGAATEVAFAVG